MIDKTEKKIEELLKKNKNLKFIVVTGGVLSGLGKGISAASIGNLLSDNYKVIPIKCEGYLNVDPGTMNPYEHGEVFVLEDGEEADMDFGHYERFINVYCKREWNITMGKVFKKILDRERKGYYLGKTVQFVPHVTNTIKESWLEIVDKEKADFIILEIGGTVGDIETELHLEAARQLKRILKDKVLFVHLTYVPKPENINEYKTKPTQQSLMILREKGINPDIILIRSEGKITKKAKEKIALFSNLKEEDIFDNYNVNNVYKIPLLFEEQGLIKKLEEKFKIKIKKDLKKWKRLVENLEKNEKNNIKNNTINIAIAGKYTDLEDSYASVIEALKHSSAHLNVNININFLETTNIKSLKDVKKEFEKNSINAVIVPGGFGSRGIEGKIKIIQYSRENNIPFLGICYGLQLSIIEYSRNVVGLKDAHTTEIKKNTKYKVVDILPEQKKVKEKGGTMRLGSYPAILKEGKIKKYYKKFGLIKKNYVYERHRHRYEVNPKYHKYFKDFILHLNPEGKLVEFIELKNHDYFVASQGHIELKSTLLKPAPLFYGLIETTIKQQKNKNKNKDKKIEKTTKKIEKKIKER